jgi:hypothetical protein
LVLRCTPFRIFLMRHRDFEELCLAEEKASATIFDSRSVGAAKMTSNVGREARAHLTGKLLALTHNERVNSASTVRAKSAMTNSC